MIKRRNSPTTLAQLRNALAMSGITSQCKPRKDKGGSGSKRWGRGSGVLISAINEVLISAVNFHFRLLGVPSNEPELLVSC